MNNFLLVLLLLLCSSCATFHRETSGKTSPPETLSTEALNDLAIYALSMAETPYVYGGATPQTGFDCSGFVYHVFQKSAGLQLPRTSVEMSRMGMPLNNTQLQAGDLVFFNTQQQPFSHVGIYVGEGRFVHAPKTGKAISIAELKDDYWRSRYDGARRMTSENPSSR